MISSAILLHQIGGEIMLLLVYNLWEKIITGSKDGQRQCAHAIICDTSCVK